MDQVQASLQLTIASGGRVLLVGEEVPETGQSSLQVAPTVQAALKRLEHDPIDVVVCGWPDGGRFVKAIPLHRRVSVMMTAPAGPPRDAALAFAHRSRNCAVLPTSFSMFTLLGADGLGAESGLSANYLRRLPRLTGLWGRRKTGVVQFLCPDGVWDWIEVKKGGLVRAGDPQIIKDALQAGRIRFIDRTVIGDASQDAMTRLLLELAGTNTDSRFASTHGNWVPHSHRASSFPLSAASRGLLSAIDGVRPLWLLLRELRVPAALLGEELHALVRLRLVRLLPPDDYTLQPLHRIIDRLAGDRARLARARSVEVFGLPAGAPRSMRRKIARWQTERYARISEEPALPDPAAAEAVALSDSWREIFAAGTG